MVEKVRIDKWLWAARFFKTRSLAAKAAGGGLVHINNGRVKSSRPVNIGDILQITKGPLEFTVEVLALAEKRGPAKVAQTLYAETADSIIKREASREARKIERMSRPIQDKGRPSKRDKRLIRDFMRK